MKKFIFILCAAFLTFALVLGFITYNKTTQALLSVNIEALTNNENEETSNNEGSNNKGDGSKFYYEHLQGKPKTCILFRNVSLNGEISFSSEKQTGTLGYTSVKVEGIMEICDKGGSWVYCVFMPDYKLKNKIFAHSSECAKKKTIIIKIMKKITLHIICIISFFATACSSNNAEVAGNVKSIVFNSEEKCDELRFQQNTRYHLPGHSPCDE